jgi:hypothetical protein
MEDRSGRHEAHRFEGVKCSGAPAPANVFGEPLEGIENRGIEMTKSPRALQESQVLPVVVYFAGTVGPVPANPEPPVRRKRPEERQLAEVANIPCVAVLHREAYRMSRASRQSSVAPLRPNRDASEGVGGVAGRSTDDAFQ